ncbi:TPA: hypothetical protein HMU92_09800 [Escherichia coli]|nr:hypothetical protein [Escherichia coli]TZB92794.1 hypothetical protein E0K57_17300 [Escherichia coli]HAJ3586186.1 hypothetical protein [Escherichia coli]
MQSANYFTFRPRNRFNYRSLT